MRDDLKAGFLALLGDRGQEVTIQTKEDFAPFTFNAVISNLERGNDTLGGFTEEDDFDTQISILSDDVSGSGKEIKIGMRFVSDGTKYLIGNIKKAKRNSVKNVYYCKVIQDE